MSHHDRDDLDERELLLAILLALEDIAALLSPPTNEPVTGTITFQGGTMSDTTVPPGTASETATATFFDANDNVVAAESVPVWASSDETIQTVDASADPTGATAVVTILADGSATITATTTNNDGTTVVASGTLTREAAPAPEPATGDVTFA